MDVAMRAVDTIKSFRVRVPKKTVFVKNQISLTTLRCVCVGPNRRSGHPHERIAPPGRILRP
jgi:hypothetical protein